MSDPEKVVVERENGKKETEDKADKAGNAEEEGYRTPIQRKEPMKRSASTTTSQIADITLSPKRKKQSVGMTPYSRNRHVCDVIHSAKDTDKGKRLGYSNWKALCQFSASISEATHRRNSASFASAAHCETRQRVGREHEQPSHAARGILQRVAVLKQHEERSCFSFENDALVVKFQDHARMECVRIMILQEFAKTGKMVTSFTEAMKEEKTEVKGRALFSDD